MLHGGESSEEEGVDFGMGAVLGLLALPGVFSSLFLADKYGSLFLVLRGNFNFDPYTASLPDEYFFIVLSMAVTASVAVWKWDSLIPDRRDYLNLAPLPVHSRSFFLANLLALTSLAAVLSLDVNAASAALFPLVVCGSRSSFRYFEVFFGTHLACVVLASIFSFLVVLMILAALISVLPLRLFRRFSLYFRCAIVTLILAMLSTSSSVPSLIHALSENRHPWLKWLPSVWFVSLGQSMLGGANPLLSSLARTAVVAICVAPLLAVCAYGFSYRRCFTHGAETMMSLPFGGGVIAPRIFRLLDRLVFRSPFERASFRFTLKALARGESQALVMGWFGGLGIVIVSQSLVTALNAPPGPVNHIPTSELLGVPLMLGYVLLLGLRCAFDVPASLRANWLFRLTVNPETHECAPFARKVVLVFLLPSLFLVCLPLYAHFWGWPLAVTHVAIVAAMCLLFAEVLFTPFRKIPFTCSMPTFKNHSLALILLYIVGFFFFGSLIPAAEHWALEDPLRFILFAPLPPAVWIGMRQWQRSLTYLDKKIIFQEKSPRAVETMDLTFGP